MRELADVPSDLSIRWITWHHQLGGVDAPAEQAGECLHELLHQNSERLPQASIIVVSRLSLLVPFGELLLLFNLFRVPHYIEQTHAEESRDLRILQKMAEKDILTFTKVYSSISFFVRPLVFADRSWNSRVRYR